jgi:hypothetical protein
MPVIILPSAQSIGGSGSGVPSGQTLNPEMTDNNLPAPFLVVDAANTDGRYAVWKAFNHNNQDTGWAGRPDSDGELWFAYNHRSPVVVNQTRATVWPSGSWNLTSYEVYGTNDDFTDVSGVQAATWTLLDTVNYSGWVSHTWSPYFQFANDVAYSGYMMKALSWGSSGAQVQEFEFVAA